jgi:hypothetical protein
MSLQAIYIQNNSAKVTDEQITNMISGLDILVPIFCNDWGLKTIQILTLPKTENVTSQVCIYIQDAPDVSGLIGYHSQKAGNPYGKVFVNPILNNGGAILYNNDTPNGVTVAQCLSHEIFEMIIDPYCISWWAMPNGKTLVAGEVSDPVQGNIVKLDIGSTTIGFSDWVLPKWTDTQAKVGPFNYLNTLTAPYTMSKNGYMIQYNNGKITNVFGDLVPSWFKELKTNTSVRSMTRLEGKADN